MIEPYDWQSAAVSKQTELLNKGTLALNLSETGTGKTVMGLVTARSLGARPLVVAPLAVHTDWKTTAREAGVKLAGVINSQKLIRKNKWFDGKRWQLPSDAIVIWDEIDRGASGIKSKTSAVAAHLKGIPSIPMSATLADTPLKLRAVGFLCGLHSWSLYDYYRWCRKMGCFKNIHGGLEFPRGKVGDEKVLELHEMLKPFAVRIRIADVPEFPESIIQVRRFDLKHADEAEVNAIFAAFPDKLNEESEHQMVQLLRARQKMELLKVPFLTTLAIDAYEEGKAPIVFVNFRETLAQLEHGLTKAGISYGSIYGGDTQDRAEVCRVFREDKLDAMLCMASAGGIGLSMHDVRGERARATFLSPSYNASEMKQCLGRAPRSGGKSKTLQTFVTIAGTVEDRVYDALKRKQKRIEMLADGDLML